MQKRWPGLWLTCCVKLKQFHCKHQAKKASHTLTYILFKIQTIPLSASCGKGLLNPDLHAIQNPKQPIVSIMQKRPPGPWLTYCWKPQTITLSASCRKGLQEPDLHPVQNAQQPIVSIMQRRPPGPWLTSCLKPRPFCCQHDAGNAFWSLIYLLFKSQSSPLSASCRKGLLHPNLQTVQNPEQLIVSITQKRPPAPQLTGCSKFSQLSASCRKGLLTLTYMLFKMQSSPLSAWWRKGLLDPDLQSVQNPTNSIVSIMQKKPLGPWLTPCLKSKQCHCQHHTEKATWTLTYILFTTQTIPSSASCQKDLLSLTYRLFKTQSSPLWASCKQNPLGTWLTYCSQSK